MIKRLAALIYTMDGKPIDCGRIVNSYAVMKSGTSVISAFRGNASMCVAAIVASGYAEETNGDLAAASVATSIINIIIATQVAMIAAASASN